VQNAHVVLHVLDGDAVRAQCEMTSSQRVMHHAERELDSLLDGVRPDVRVITVMNKADLFRDSWRSDASEEATACELVLASCVTEGGLDDVLSILVRAMQQVVGDSGGGDSEPVITRARHRRHIQASVAALTEFRDGFIRDGVLPLDMATEELRLAASELAEITGSIQVEDILDRIFNDFCIGK